MSMLQHCVGGVECSDDNNEDGCSDRCHSVQSLQKPQAAAAKMVAHEEHKRGALPLISSTSCIPSQICSVDWALAILEALDT